MVLSHLRLKLTVCVRGIDWNSFATASDGNLFISITLPTIFHFWTIPSTFLFFLSEYIWIWKCCSRVLALFFGSYYLRRIDDLSLLSFGRLYTLRSCTMDTFGKCDIYVLVLNLSTYAPILLHQVTHSNWKLLFFYGHHQQPYLHYTSTTSATNHRENHLIRYIALVFFFFCLKTTVSFRLSGFLWWKLRSKFGECHQADDEWPGWLTRVRDEKLFTFNAWRRKLQTQPLVYVWYMHIDREMRSQFTERNDFGERPIGTNSNALTDMIRNYLFEGRVLALYENHFRTNDEKMVAMN